MRDILALRDELYHLEETKKQLEQTITDLKAKLFEAVEANGDSFSADDGYVTKVVRPVRKSYDWDKIKKKIGGIRFKTITKQVPDETLLTDAIANGSIKLNEIAGSVTEKATTPYVRTYKVRAEEE